MPDLLFQLVPGACLLLVGAFVTSMFRRPLTQLITRRVIPVPFPLPRAYARLLV